MDTTPATMDKTRLFSKMAAVMGALSAIPKMGTNTFHNYKYVTASDVADAIREQMAAQNLAFFAETVGVTEQGGRYVIEYLYTFACGDTGAIHSCRWFGEAIAVSQKGVPDDKAMTKAATTAQKYFLLKTFIVSTSDDPDLDHDSKPARAQLVEKAKANLGPAKPARPNAAPPPDFTPRVEAPAGPDADETTANDIVSYVEVRATSDGKPYIVAEGGLTSFTREPFRKAGIACDDWTTPGDKHVLDKPLLVRYVTKGDYKNIVEVEAA